MKNTLPLRLRFGVFELDLKSGELHKSGHRVVLQEQPLQILRILLEHAGEIANREEIQQQLWPNDTVVEFDHSINAAIKKLRVALGDSADNPKYIETVARRGYRLMVPVERLDSTAGDTSGTGVVSSSHDGTGVELQLEPAGLTGKTVSHYRVLEVVGGGGMGVVYKAEDLKLGRAVALKFLPEEVGSDPRALERFEREARAASSLDHPNICSIHEFGEHEGRPFIVMQLLQGQTLRDCLASGALKDTASGAQVSLDRLLDIAIQIADGLEAAHEQGIVHRDIKPANIFITNKGVAKILDFGLAKLPLQPSGLQAIPAELGGGETLNPSLTVRAAGTAAYMSPEQVRGQKLDAGTDLFSFGVVLYEMATGRRAFTGDNPAALQDAILNRPLTPPAELNPELPTELQDVIQKCLEKDRTLRYHKAAEIRLDLEKVKRRREHPVFSRWRLLATVAVVVVALLAGVFYWRSRKIRLTDTDTVVLANFVNTTGEAVFDDALNTALSAEFQQSPYLNLLSPDKVSRTLKLMNQPSNEGLAPALAREVCLRTNSKALVAGSISDAGNHYLIELNAVDCHTGKSLVKTEKEAMSRNEVVKTLGAAGNEIRSKLGEPRASLQKFNKPLDEATSSSVEALQAFAEGDKRKRQDGDVPATFSYFNRAAELDPNFAQAYLRLGIGYLNVHQGDLGVQNLKKAYELRDRVTERDRFSIEAFYEILVTGQANKSIQILTDWAKTYPAEALAHGDLSADLMSIGQYEKAAAEARESVRLRPTGVGYVNLMTSYLRQNRLDEAKASFDEARANNLNDPNLFHLRYILGFLQGDNPGMQEQVAWTIGKPGAEDMLLSAHSDTQAYYGRFGKARELSQQAVDSAKRAGAPQAAGAWRLDEALREAEIGNAPQARQQAAEALSLSTQRNVQTSAALALARAGDATQAENLCEKLNQDYPLDTWTQSYLLPTIRAAIELQRNNPHKAIDILRVALPYEMGDLEFQSFAALYPAYVRGEAYLKAGQGSQAAAEFQKIIDHPGIVNNFITGALAHLQLGRAHAMMGDKEAARKSYQDFFALWKDADPDLPILHAAKAEYAKLK